MNHKLTLKTGLNRMACTPTDVVLDDLELVGVTSIEIFAKSSGIWQVRLTLNLDGPPVFVDDKAQNP